MAQPAGIPPAPGGRTEPPRFATRISTRPLFITIKHPKGLHILLQLPCIDRSKDGVAQGVHYETVMTACAIIAHNKFDEIWLGEFRLGRGLQKIHLPKDGILTSGVYFLIVSKVENDYQTVSTFHSWSFPRLRQLPLLPPTWTEAIPYPVLSPSKTEVCAVSLKATAVERAHLLPATEGEWFTKQEISQFCAPREGHELKNKANILPLKSDLHHAFKKDEWVIAPKSGAFTTHLVHYVPAGLYPEYHNMVVHGLEEPGAPYFLFAAFARTIISLHHELQGLKTAKAIVPQKREAQELSADHLQMSKSSPSKRQRVHHLWD